MDTTSSITHIGLCAGYGGIELGLARVIPNLRSVALCEIEAFAIANLVAKMEAGFMDPAPIWPDLKTFPWGAFHNRVDILTGGYPCQPFSVAGMRKGKDDHRHLWPWIADGIASMRPRICFFENVEGHISMGLSTVISDLEEIGYQATWGVFSAAECGAPHQRKRVFILAYSRHLQSGRRSEPVGSTHSNSSDCGKNLDHPDGQGSKGTYHNRQVSIWIQKVLMQSGFAGEKAMADSKRIRFYSGGSDTGQSKKSEPEYRSAWPSPPGNQQYGWEPPRVVANGNGINRGAPTKGWEHDRQAGSASEEMGDPKLSESSRFSHFSRKSACNQESGGLGEKHADGVRFKVRKAQSSMGGDLDGTSSGMDYTKLQVCCDSRIDELRLLGNGVVPATAALAFRTLASQLHRQGTSSGIEP